MLKNSCLIGLIAIMSSCNSYLRICGERIEYTNVAEELNESVEVLNFSKENRVSEPFEKIRIPVVFHVLYRTESMKVSAEKLKSEIELLNQSFSASDPDLASKVPEEYKDLIGKASIEFYLADVDPQGNPTEGIIYKKTRRKFYSFKRPIFYADKLWNPKKYMNVYVGNVRVNAFMDTSGYVDHPNIWTSPKKDAIAVSYQLMGRGQKLLTHETGHWLGLRHIFERKGKCDAKGDQISDTPNQKTSTSGCPDQKMQCENFIFFFNFMDYSKCRVMFTKEQVARMHTVVAKHRSGFIKP